MVLKEAMFLAREIFYTENNTTLLSLRREICLLAHHLHKTFSTFYSKTWTVQQKGTEGVGVGGGGVVDIVRFCQQAVVDCGEIKIPPLPPHSLLTLRTFYLILLA